MDNVLTFAAQTVDPDKAAIRQCMVDGKYVAPQTKAAAPVASKEWQPDVLAVPRSARARGIETPISGRDDLAWDEADLPLQYSERNRHGAI